MRGRHFAEAVDPVCGVIVAAAAAGAAAHEATAAGAAAAAAAWGNAVRCRLMLPALPPPQR